MRTSLCVALLLIANLTINIATKQNENTEEDNWEWKSSKKLGTKKNVEEVPDKEEDIQPRFISKMKSKFCKGLGMDCGDDYSHPIHPQTINYVQPLVIKAVGKPIPAIAVHGHHPHGYGHGKSHHPHGYGYGKGHHKGGHHKGNHHHHGTSDQHKGYGKGHSQGPHYAEFPYHFKLPEHFRGKYGKKKGKGNNKKLLGYQYEVYDHYQPLFTGNSYGTPPHHFNSHHSSNHHSHSKGHPPFHHKEHKGYSHASHAQSYGSNNGGSPKDIFSSPSSYQTYGQAPKEIDPYLGSISQSEFHSSSGHHSKETPAGPPRPSDIIGTFDSNHLQGGTKSNLDVIQNHLQGGTKSNFNVIQNHLQGGTKSNFDVIHLPSESKVPEDDRPTYEFPDSENFAAEYRDIQTGENVIKHIHIHKHVHQIDKPFKSPVPEDLFSLPEQSYISTIDDSIANIPSFIDSHKKREILSSALATKQTYTTSCTCVSAKLCPVGRRVPISINSPYSQDPRNSIIQAKILSSDQLPKSSRKISSFFPTADHDYELYSKDTPDVSDETDVTDVKQTNQRPKRNTFYDSSLIDLSQNEMCVEIISNNYRRRKRNAKFERIPVQKVNDPQINTNSRLFGSSGLDGFLGHSIAPAVGLHYGSLPNDNSAHPYGPPLGGHKNPFQLDIGPFSINPFAGLKFAFINGRPVLSPSIDLLVTKNKNRYHGSPAFAETLPSYGYNQPPLHNIPSSGYYPANHGISSLGNQHYPFAPGLEQYPHISGVNAYPHHNHGIGQYLPNIQQFAGLGHSSQYYDNFRKNTGITHGGAFHNPLISSFKPSPLYPSLHSYNRFHRNTDSSTPNRSQVVKKQTVVPLQYTNSNPNYHSDAQGNFRPSVNSGPYQANVVHPGPAQPYPSKHIQSNVESIREVGQVNKDAFDFSSNGRLSTKKHSFNPLRVRGDVFSPL